MRNTDAAGSRAQLLPLSTLLKGLRRIGICSLIAAKLRLFNGRRPEGAFTCALRGLSWENDAPFDRQSTVAQTLSEPRRRNGELDTSGKTVDLRRSD